MVLFVGVVHIFMFSLILLSRYSHFCELILKPLKFQAKRREGLVAGVSLSEAYVLSEALSSLSVLGNPRRGSVTDAHTQCSASSPNESFVPSHAQRVQLAKPDFTNSRLAS